MNKALAFDDLLIIPQYSDIESIDRQILTTTFIGKCILDVPIISAAMDTVTNMTMLNAMRENGGTGIHHRYTTQDVLLHAVRSYYPIAISPSMGTEFADMVASTGMSSPIVAIDVAHGHRRQVLDYAEYCVSLGLEVWSGNIATPKAAEEYLNRGVTVLKVGIGGGSACSTRVVSGCGYPLAQSIIDIDREFLDDATILADGGIKNSGDIVKALALGAKAVICGRLLAGAEESAGKEVLLDGLYKQYRGMASKDALQNAGKRIRVEGVHGVVPYAGPLEKVINELVDGIQTGMSYVGAHNLAELRRKARFVEITQAGQYEGIPRIGELG